MNEIGCMCSKCNCSKTTLPVTAVCDSCLKGDHTNQLKHNLTHLNANKTWRVEIMESTTDESEGQ